MPTKPNSPTIRTTSDPQQVPNLEGVPIFGTPLPPAFAQLRDSFALTLRARNCSPRTIQTYLESVTLLCRYLLTHAPEVTGPAHLTRAHIEGFLAQMLADGQTAATADNRYRGVRAWVRWLVEEEEIAVNPMRAVHPPMVQVQPPPVLSEEDLAALFKTCEGKRFADRRDTAIIRVLLDTGMRLEELAGLRLCDLNLPEQVIAIGRANAKFRKARPVPIGSKTGVALDRYLRARARHPYSESEEAQGLTPEARRLWLGLRGPMRGNGIYQMLRARAAQAGVADVFTHRFRHTATHRQLAAGAQESNVMAIMGWDSSAMLRRYGAAQRAERARAEFKRLRVNEDL